MDANDDTLGREGNTPGVRDGDDAVAEREPLVAESRGRVGGLEERLARDVLDRNDLEVRDDLLRGEVVRELLEGLDGGLCSLSRVRKRATKGKGND